MDKSMLKKYDQIVEKNLKERGYKQHGIDFANCAIEVEDLNEMQRNSVYERIVHGREWVENGQVNIEYGIGLKAVGKKILSKMINFRIWAVQNYYDEYLVNNQKLVEQLYISLREQQQECTRLEERIEQLEKCIKKDEVQ